MLLVRDRQLKRYSGLLDDAVPAPHSGYGILDVIVAQFFVERVERRRLRCHRQAQLHLMTSGRTADQSFQDLLDLLERG
jgi:hypothetical protein